VPKHEHASRDFYDVWLPELAPSEALVPFAQKSGGAAGWRTFIRRYRSEMKRPAAARLLRLLAALSQDTALSVGCYCEDESRCHRALLRELLEDAGAAMAS